MVDQLSTQPSRDERESGLEQKSKLDEAVLQVTEKLKAFIQRLGNPNGDLGRTAAEIITRLEKAHAKKQKVIVCLTLDNNGNKSTLVASKSTAESLAESINRLNDGHVRAEALPRRIKEESPYVIEITLHQETPHEIRVKQDAAQAEAAQERKSKIVGELENFSQASTLESITESLQKLADLGHEFTVYDSNTRSEGVRYASELAQQLVDLRFYLDKHYARSFDDLVKMVKLSNLIVTHNNGALRRDIERRYFPDTVGQKRPEAAGQVDLSKNFNRVRDARDLQELKDVLRNIQRSGEKVYAMSSSGMVVRNPEDLLNQLQAVEQIALNPGKGNFDQAFQNMSGVLQKNETVMNALRTLHAKNKQNASASNWVPGWMKRFWG